ncbi:MAG: hypothetical protein MI724_04085 [Spirochaetales bacterium]|nr:hypothetical protein [Spirochaetales bacterium]
MSSALESRVSEIEWALRELAYAQLRTERSVELLSHEMKEFKTEMRTFKDEMRTDRRSLNRQWGDLANRLGTIVEDIVAPNIPGVLGRYFDVAEPDIDLLMVCPRRRHPNIPDKRREFDVIAITAGTLYVNETKATMRREYVDSFADTYLEVLDYFPEYGGRDVVPIMSSLYLEPDMVGHITARGMYAMQMSDDSMYFVNFEAIAR